MSDQVEFFAIRIVGTDCFMINKHQTFGTFKDAMNMGVFFNTRVSAEKRVRAEMKQFKALDGYPLSSTGYQTFIDGQWESFTTMQEFADMVGGQYEITVRDIELEVVPLVMTIKKDI